MGGALDDLSSLIHVKKKPKTKKAGVSVTAPVVVTTKCTTEIVDAFESLDQKKQKMLLLESGSNAEVPKDGQSLEKVETEKTPLEIMSMLYQFTPTLRSGQPVLVTDSVRDHPKLALPLLPGVCLHEDMKKVPADLDSNIADMFSHLTLSAVAMHNKLLSVTRGVVATNNHLKEDTKLRAKAEKQVREMTSELEVARLQLSELELIKKLLAEFEDPKRQVTEMKSKLEQKVKDVHKAGFKEAKEAMSQYYLGQVKEISDASFKKGAKIYYFKGVTKGYLLGMDSTNVQLESNPRDVPEVALSKIEIPESGDEDREEEKGEIEENVDENEVVKEGRGR